MWEFLDRFFDEPVLLALNSFANLSKTLDLAITRFMMLDSVRAIPIVATVIFVAYWKSSHGKLSETFAVATGGGFVAILVSRIAQNISERPRPVYADIAGFQLPFGVKENIPADWSSFPSDTSALVFALATAVFVRSRQLGCLCFLWALVVACMPRIYSGYHYPSDVIAGGLIGIISTALVSAWMPSRVVEAGEAIRRRYEPFYHAAIFCVLYLTATMFSDVRQTFNAIGDILL